MSCFFQYQKADILVFEITFYRPAFKVKNPQKSAIQVQKTRFSLLIIMQHLQFAVTVNVIHVHIYYDPACFGSTHFRSIMYSFRLVVPRVQERRVFVFSLLFHPSTDFYSTLQLSSVAFMNVTQTIHNSIACSIHAYTSTLIGRQKTLLNLCLVVILRGQYT